MSEGRDQEDLLQSALSSAFAPVSITPAAVPHPDSNSAPESTPEVPVPTSAPVPLVSQEDLAKYEEERLTLEQSWREESAVQRREAEERRERIAAERAARGESWEGTRADESIKGPPNPVFNPRTGEAKGYPGGPSIADARDVVFGEPSGTRQVEASAQVSPPTTATLEQSQRWEDIEAESLESSYPSLSYPEHSQSESASAPSSEHGPARSRNQGKTTKHPTAKGKPSESEKPSSKQEGEPGSVPVPTLSVFDSRLSTRTRLIALFSSLSINLFLPFVNGVMLGFGEIFARNLAVRFFGWKIPETSRAPGGAATAVGVRGTGSASERRRR